MKDTRVKQIFSRGGYQGDRDRDKKRVNESKYGGCIFYTYMKNRRMKPVEIVQKRGRRRKRENNGVGKSKIYCKHTYKYHNLSPCTTIM
jgi:hypothetical protein